jgi:hypothetical protein
VADVRQQGHHFCLAISFFQTSSPTKPWPDNANPESLIINPISIDRPTDCLALKTAGISPKPPFKAARCGPSVTILSRGPWLHPYIGSWISSLACQTWVRRFTSRPCVCYACRVMMEAWLVWDPWRLPDWALAEILFTDDHDEDTAWHTSRQGWWLQHGEVIA